MKKILLVLLLTGCTKPYVKTPLSCMDGYLITNTKGLSAFCFTYTRSYSALMGHDCYGVTGASPRANIETLVLPEGWVAPTQCYNADRD